MVVVAIMIVSKFYSDKFYLNHTVGEITGLEVSEVNILELEFLRILDFDIRVSNDEYDEYFEGLTKFFGEGHQEEIIEVTDNI